MLKLIRGDSRMKKYKRVRKHKFNVGIITLVLICVLILIGISYSAWTTNLTIYGSISAEQTSQNQIPV